MPALTAALLAVLVAGLALLPSPDDGPARIDLKPEGEALVVRGIFEAAQPPADTLTYRLDVTKHGASGRSTSRQGGAFAPRPHRPDTLSTVRLGVQPGDTVEVALEVSGSAGPVADAYHREVIR